MHVIVGAGVVGASVAYHLARRGVRDVLVVDEHDAAGRGSTSRATGGFRAQFGTEINVRLSLLSREKLRRFADETGVDPGYDPRGYVFLAQSEEELAALAAAQEIQKRCGLGEVRMISREEAAELTPAVAPEHHIGGAFCPTDGFIRPLQILQGYLEAAQRLGARVRYGSRVTGFRTSGSRIVEIDTTDGAIAVDAVINAGGAWAAGVTSSLGIDLPVVPRRRQVASTVLTDALPASTPMTIFAGDGFHFRVRDGRILLLWPDELPVGDSFSTDVDRVWLQEIVRLRDERLPSLRDIPLDREHCWGGLYEMSPDRHAILGRAPEWENLWLANGNSGHGVMHAPALGELLAAMIVGERPGVDVTPLRPERFAEGSLNRGVELL
jgi:sarcosine oxidase subunit beta